MKFKELIFVASVLMVGFQSARAAECQSNGLGGSFCVNDDGTTTDSIPNEVNGEEKYSDNGTLTSTSPVEDGDDQMLSGSDPSDSTHALSNTLHSSSDQQDDSLVGKSWNKPANLNGDGAATSSMDMVSH